MSTFIRVILFRSLALASLFLPLSGVMSAEAASPSGSTPGVVNSRGALVAQTFCDRQAAGSTGRMVAINPPGSSWPGVQFAFTRKMSDQSFNPPFWVFNAYEPVWPSFVYPGGEVVVQSSWPGTNEAGEFPKIAVDANGKAMLGAYDWRSAKNPPYVDQMHVVIDDSSMYAIFGDINSGLMMPNSVRDSASIAGGTTCWPTIAVSEVFGRTVTYVAAYERVGSGELGAMKVFRRQGTEMNPVPADEWTLVFTDTTAGPFQDIQVSTVSSNVGVVWTKPTPTDDDPRACDVWVAESPMGYSGIWIRTNVTNYSGPGYRASGDLACMYDTQGYLHIIWTAYQTDGTTFTDRRSRLLHWSTNTGIIRTVYIADWDPATVECTGGPDVRNIGHLSIAECEGRLYVLFTSWNDFYRRGVGDDCGRSAPRASGANGELYVTISPDLLAANWDTPRNLSNSYTPGCDTGTCADDRFGSLSVRPFDDDLYPGTETWPAAATYDPSGYYGGTQYLQVFYITDRYPAPGYRALHSPLEGPLTNNDMRWIRLACAAPAFEADLVAAPPKIAFPTWVPEGTEKQVSLVLQSRGVNPAVIQSIQTIEDSTKPSVAGGWLGYTGTPAVIVQGNSASMTLQLNKGGTIVSGPVQCWGRLVINYATPAKTLTVPIAFTVVNDTPRVMLSGTRARPGFSKTYYVSYENCTDRTQSNAQMTLTLPAGVAYAGSLPAGTHNPANRTVTWALGSLAPSAVGDLVCNVTVSPSEPLGSVLTSSAVLTCTDPVKGSLVVTANEQETVTGSWDPNDKQVWPVGTGPNHTIRPTDTLHYQVNFQNVGTDTAFQVVVRDSLPADLDMTTLILGPVSHPYTLNTNGRVLTWSFADINLPDSATDPAGSSGFVSYSIRPRSNAPNGTSILNDAEVYFDYNAAVATNAVFHTIGTSCCVGTTGNVNTVGIVDLSDLSMLIAYLTAPVKPVLSCPEEANINGTGIIDLTDLSLLIAYLTATPKPTLPNCP